MSVLKTCSATLFSSPLNDAVYWGCSNLHCNYFLFKYFVCLLKGSTIKKAKKTQLSAFPDHIEIIFLLRAPPPFRFLMMFFPLYIVHLSYLDMHILLKFSPFECPFDSTWKLFFDISIYLLLKKSSKKKSNKGTKLVGKIKVLIFILFPCSGIWLCGKGSPKSI